MRALHVIPAVASRYGGPSTAIGPMCRALVNQGIETQILATDADGPGRLAVPLAAKTTWDGVPAIFFRRNASEAFKYSFGLSRWLRGHVQEFDVVHVHAVLSHASLAAGAACRRAGVPYIVRPLGTIARWSLGQKPWRKKAVLALAANRMLRRAAAIHCTSQGERDDAIAVFGLTRSVVIPLGIDPSWSDAGVAVRDSARPYVLALSRLHPKKDLELLIDAFLDAKEQVHGGWRLVIAGDGDRDYVARLGERIVARGAGDRVSLQGWVEGSAKQQLVRGAALFALASRHENFGLAVLEAMAAGVPALVSEEVQIAHEIQAAGAGWVVARTRDAFTRSLQIAMTNPELRERASRSARTLGARFTWPQVGRQLASLYRAACSADGIQDASLVCAASGR